MRGRRAFVLLSLLGATAVAARAQEVDLTRVESTNRIMPAWLGGSLTFHVAPEIRFRAGGLVGDAAALLGAGRQEPRRASGQVIAAFGVPSISSVRFETEFGAFRSQRGPDIRMHGFDGAFRLMHQDRGGMVWIGASLASSWDDASSSGDETSRQARSLMGGVWKVFGPAGIGLSVRAVEYDEEIVFGRDTTYEVLGIPFTSRRTEQIVYDHYYVDAELIASRRVGPVAVHLEGGGRLTRRSVREPRVWVRGGIEIPVLPDVALQLAAGQRPNLPEYRVEAGSFASVGVQLELGRNAWTPGPPLVPDHPPHPDAPSAELRPLPEGGTWELLIRNVPGANVEIMGDPTDWRAVGMERLAFGTWRTVLRLAPGTYRINLRIDGGAWEELPGYPTARDEFGGVVGVIVVETDGG